MTQPSQHSGTGPSQRPGQMTAVMRAVAATGPKVLRIGVVQNGRVTEERIVKQRGHVTIGPSEKNLFVITSDQIPSSFRLFEIVGNDYHLNFLDGMQGRIALPTGISDMNVLKGQARRTSQGAYQIRLTEDSRGKVVIGDTTFLFQFVAPPPMQPKPQLPVAVLRGAGAIDWNSTIIAAFSFLFHFVLLGAIYSDWLDPIVDDEVAVAGLIDSLKNLPPPPPVEDKPEEKEEAKAEEKAEVKAEPKPAGGGPKGPAPGAGALSQREAAAVSNQLEQLEMATLGALSASGPATAGVLKGGEVATGALDQAAASGAGVGVGSGDLRLGGGGGALRPGAVGGGLAGIGSTGRGTGTSGSGTAAAVAGPKGNANVGGAAVSGGSVSNAARVVAGMRAGFRACYQRGLNENPDASGSIRLTIQVGPGGEVSNVTAVPSGSLPPSVVSCVQARARAAQFDRPEGGAATIQVPVQFLKQ
ncbi:MAG TPA: AgmX/PglI C-terminal domain-containing protein [Polyangiaceae bacterium]|nr:AgmX/PglI C-terminal domain-containing protein [Polyangiaceae bacterium]